MEFEPSHFINGNLTNKSLIKRHLPNSSVIKKHVSLKRCTNILRYTWSVGSYDELQNGVIYESFVEKVHHSCTFSSEKTEKTFVLRAVISGSLVEKGNVQMYVCLSERKSSDASDPLDPSLLKSNFVLAIEETMGKFIAKFPTKIIAHRYDTQRAPLFVIYHFVSRPREKPLLFWTGKTDRKSVTQISCHISLETNNLSFPDFKIIARKRVFPAHKCLLAVRSRFFSEYFRAQGDVRQLEVDAYPGIVWYVLRYVYDGHIDILDINTMIQVLQLAESWKILTLVESCSDYLRSHIEPDDMKKAVEVGLEVPCLELLKLTKRLEKLTLDDTMKKINSKSHENGVHKPFRRIRRRN